MFKAANKTTKFVYQESHIPVGQGTGRQLEVSCQISIRMMKKNKAGCEVPSGGQDKARLSDEVICKPNPEEKNPCWLEHREQGRGG